MEFFRNSGTPVCTIRLLNFRTVSYYVYMQPLVRPMLVRSNLVHFKFTVYMHPLVRI
jgi:hypothetical protein